MNTIAWLGRLVIERIRGIGAAAHMLLQIIFSFPTKGGFGRFVYQMHRVGVMSLLIIAVSVCLLARFLACKCIAFWSLSVLSRCWVQRFR